MARSKQKANPFYIVLLIVGVVFVVTAVAFAVMTLIQVRTGSLPGPGQSGHALMRFMSDHGVTALLWELAILAVATFGAIASDRFWAGDTTSSRMPDNPRGPSAH